MRLPRPLERALQRSISRNESRLTAILRASGTLQRRFTVLGPGRRRRADVRLLTRLANGRSRPLLWLLVTPKLRRVRCVRPADPTADLNLFVPYGSEAAALQMDGFVLTVDGDAHRRERARIADVLSEVRLDGSAHHDGLVAAHSAMTRAFHPGVQFAAKPLLEDSIERWASTLFGLDPLDVSGGSQASLLEAGRAVMNRSLFNIPAFRAFSRQRAEADEHIVAEFHRRVTGAPDPDPGTVLNSLRASDPAHATRDVVGLIGGATELLLEAALSILDWALVDPRNWARAHGLAERSADATSFVDGVASLVALAPPQYFLMRRSAPGTSRWAKLASRNVTSRSLTLVSLWTPHAKPVVDQHDPVFGIAPHRCLGRSLALDALAHLLHPVFRFPVGTPGHNFRPSDPPDNQATWMTVDWSR